MSEPKFRLVTRSDFDGLVCAVLLNELEMIDDILIVHPKNKVRAGHIGQVGGDVPLGDRNLSVLHVFGVHELDIVDQVHFLEQHGADQPVKIATGNEPEFCLRHGALR